MEQIFSSGARPRAGRRVPIHGNLPPIADSNNDRGRLDPSLRLSRLTLVLKPSEYQKVQTFITAWSN
jgi:hypothetical protein